MDCPDVNFKSLWMVAIIAWVIVSNAIRIYKRLNTGKDRPTPRVKRRTRGPSPVAAPGPRFVSPPPVKAVHDPRFSPFVPQETIDEPDFDEVFEEEIGSEIFADEMPDELAPFASHQAPTEPTGEAWQEKTEPRLRPPAGVTRARPRGPRSLDPGPLRLDATALCEAVVLGEILTRHRSPTARRR